MPDQTYDFRRCKFCGERTAAPLYRLAKATVYGCAACDFHAIDVLDAPPPDEPENSSGGLDPRAWAYIDERVRAHDPLPTLRLDLVRAHGALAGARCLDIGAGVGQFLLLAAAAGASPTGLEPSGLRREYARRKFGLDLNWELIETFSARPENAGAFDLVTFWDVIEHVNFPVETMMAARRILKPSGLLFIDTPSRDAAPYRLSEWLYRLTGGRVSLYLENFYAAVPFGHKQIFRPEQLVRLVQRSGFTVVSLQDGYACGAGPATRMRPRSRIVLVCRRSPDGF